MRQRRPGFSVSQTHRFRLELTLEFAERVRVRDAEQVLRRLLETMTVTAPGEVGAGLEAARLTCHETKQMIRLLPGSAARPPADRGG